MTDISILNCVLIQLLSKQDLVRYLQTYIILFSNCSCNPKYVEDGNHPVGLTLRASMLK